MSLEDGMGGTAGQLARRTTEEEDMAYFERRYQARVSIIMLIFVDLCPLFNLMPPGWFNGNPHPLLRCLTFFFNHENCWFNSLRQKKSKPDFKNQFKQKGCHRQPLDNRAQEILQGGLGKVKHPQQPSLLVRQGALVPRL